MKPPSTSFALSFMFILGACGGATVAPDIANIANSGPSLGVTNFGAMHAAMSGGAENAVSQVRLDDARQGSGAIAIGAAVSLDGEVTIVDGRTLISRTRDQSFVTEELTDPSDEGASWLTVAYVSGWTEVLIPEDLDQQGFEVFVGEAAAAAGLNVEQPFPFVLQGAVSDLRLHVLNGVCPMRPGAQVGESQAPYVYESTAGDEVQLVGFRALDSVGTLTHPGTTVHVHAVLDVEGATLTGHVERFAVRGGATLRLPQGF